MKTMASTNHRLPQWSRVYQKSARNGIGNRPAPESTVQKLAPIFGAETGLCVISFTISRGICL